MEDESCCWGGAELPQEDPDPKNLGVSPWWDGFCSSGCRENIYGLPALKEPTAFWACIHSAYFDLMFHCGPWDKTILKGAIHVVDNNYRSPAVQLGASRLPPESKRVQLFLG